MPNKTISALVLLLWAGAVWAQEPHSWTPRDTALSSVVADSDPQTHEVICTGPNHDPCDVGLQWATPATVGELTIHYSTFAGRAYQPSVAGQDLQYWDGAAWRSLPSQLTIDYSRQAEFAPLQGTGTVRWTYCFTPIRTQRVRVLLTIPQNTDPGFRCYAVGEIAASAGRLGAVGTGLHVIGELQAPPEWIEPAANVATVGAGAHVIPGKSLEVHWPQRVMVNRLKVWPVASELRAEWWDESGWRPVEPLPAPGKGEMRFLPLATRRFRITAPQLLQKVEAYLDAEADSYFRELEQSRVDLLGARFRAQRRRDLAAMQALLLPLDFAKTAIGRPADKEETIVLWNGTFLQFEGEFSGSRAPRDLWFAPAAGLRKNLFGADSTTLRSRLLDGYLPATVTTAEQDGFVFRESVFVTAPGDELYGTVAEVKVTNARPTSGRTAFTLAMGRRRNHRSADIKTSPLYFAPEVTGYSLDVDRHAVRSREGSIVLYAETPGAWEGTDRENHLVYFLTLQPGQSRTLRFFVPSVEQQLKTTEALYRLDWAASLKRFHSWWDQRLQAGMKLELPEPRLNDIYKHLLAQCLIITLDGELVRYGAYVYEEYFGVEEGWPAVALAEYGYPAEAQQIASFMLGPKQLDKSSPHHQYRNGLAPWYATTIYRLTKDRAWLGKIAPELETAAEWTLRAIHENRDPKYAGLLPRHIYGGDIGTPAYSFYSNATCWRGLQDTALAFNILNQPEKARKYQAEADLYRQRLWELADRLVEQKDELPFLPMSFDIGAGADYREKEPPYPFLGLNVSTSNTWAYLGNYWNLFAPLLLELKLFENSDPRARWLPDYMEQRGGVLAGEARFTLGLDTVYYKGYCESLLEQGRRDHFLTSLYGFLAHGMSENWHSSPEVAGVFPLRTSNAAMWREQRRNVWSWALEPGALMYECEGEPLSAGPGVALQVLRTALLRESLESSAADGLRLLDGAPAHWFEPGKKIVIRDAPTFFGKVTLETEASAESIQVHLVRSHDFNAREVTLRLPHPSGQPLHEVRINGQTWRDFSGDEIRLPAGERLEIKASFVP